MSQPSRCFIASSFGRRPDRVTPRDNFPSAGWLLGSEQPPRPAARCARELRRDDDRSRHRSNQFPGLLKSVDGLIHPSGAQHGSAGIVAAGLAAISPVRAPAARRPPRRFATAPFASDPGCSTGGRACRQGAGSASNLLTTSSTCEGCKPITRMTPLRSTRA